MDGPGRAPNTVFFLTNDWTSQVFFPTPISSSHSIHTPATCPHPLGYLLLGSFPFRDPGSPLLEPLGRLLGYGRERNSQTN